MSDRGDERKASRHGLAMPPGLSGLVSRPDALTDLVAHLAAAPVVALDTEFVPEYSYRPQLCLIQVATAERLAAVDPLAFADADLVPLWQALIRPDVELVLHAAKEELSFCRHYAGGLPERIVDVQLAAGLLGHGYPLSLDGVLQAVLRSVKLDKGETRTDWRKRPLSERQVHYALNDVRYLLAAWGVIGQALEKKQREGWLDEEMARVRAASMQPDTERWRRVAGAGGLAPKDLAVLRELFGWRDRRAKRLDKPPRWILRDDLLIELAKRQPRTVKDLQTMRGVGNVVGPGTAEDVLHAVEQGATLPKEAWPERPKRRETADEQMVVKILSAALIHLAREEDVSPGLLGTNEDLRDFLLHTLDPAEPPGRLGLGWRDEVCGEYLRKVLGGDIRLRLDMGGKRPAIRFEDAEGRPARP